MYINIHFSHFLNHLKDFNYYDQQVIDQKGFNFNIILIVLLKMYIYPPEIDHSILSGRCRPFRCDALKVDLRRVVMSDGRFYLIASSSEGAVEGLLTFILWSEGAQEHVVLARDMSNHKKATKRALGTLHSYYNMIIISGALNVHHCQYQEH